MRKRLLSLLLCLTMLAGMLPAGALAEGTGTLVITTTLNNEGDRGAHVPYTVDLTGSGLTEPIDTWNVSLEDYDAEADELSITFSHFHGDTTTLDGIPAGTQYAVFPMMSEAGATEDYSQVDLRTGTIAADETITVPVAYNFADLPVLFANGTDLSAEGVESISGYQYGDTLEMTYSYNDPSNDIDAYTWTYEGPSEYGSPTGTLADGKGVLPTGGLYAITFEYSTVYSYGNTHKVTEYIYAPEVTADITYSVVGTELTGTVGASGDIKVPPESEIKLNITPNVEGEFTYYYAVWENYDYVTPVAFYPITEDTVFASSDQDGTGYAIFAQYPGIDIVYNAGQISAAPLCTLYFIEDEAPVEEDGITVTLNVYADSTLNGDPLFTTKGPLNSQLDCTGATGITSSNYYTLTLSGHEDIYDESLLKWQIGTNTLSYNGFYYPLSTTWATRAYLYESNLQEKIGHVDFIFSDKAPLYAVLDGVEYLACKQSDYNTVTVGGFGDTVPFTVKNYDGDTVSEFTLTYADGISVDAKEELKTALDNSEEYTIATTKDGSALTKIRLIMSNPGWTANIQFDVTNDATVVFAPNYKGNLVDGWESKVDASYAIGAAFTLPQPNGIVESNNKLIYGFDCWVDTETYQTYQPGETVNLRAGVNTFLARWKEVTVVNIMYMPALATEEDIGSMWEYDGSSCYDYYVTAEDDGSFVFPEPPPAALESNTVFAGWSVYGGNVGANQTTVESAHQPGDTGNISESQVYRSVAAYPTTITYQAGDASAEGEMDATVHGQYTMMEVPECAFSVPGKQFAGWRIGNDYDKVYQPGEEYQVVDWYEVTFTATWEEKPQSEAYLTLNDERIADVIFNKTYTRADAGTEDRYSVSYTEGMTEEEQNSYYVSAWVEIHGSKQYMLQDTLLSEVDGSYIPMTSEYNCVIRFELKDGEGNIIQEATATCEDYTSSFQLEKDDGTAVDTQDGEAYTLDADAAYALTAETDETGMYYYWYAANDMTTGSKELAVDTTTPASYVLYAMIEDDPTAYEAGLPLQTVTINPPLPASPFTVTLTDDNGPQELTANVSLEEAVHNTGNTSLKVETTLSADELANYTMALYPAGPIGESWSGQKDYALQEGTTDLGVVLTNADYGYHKLVITDNNINSYEYLINAEELIVTFADEDHIIEDDTTIEVPAGRVQIDNYGQPVEFTLSGDTFADDFIDLRSGDNNVDVTYTTSYGHVAHYATFKLVGMGDDLVGIITDKDAYEWTTAGDWVELDGTEQTITYSHTGGTYPELNYKVFTADEYGYATEDEPPIAYGSLQDVESVDVTIPANSYAVLIVYGDTVHDDYPVETWPIQNTGAESNAPFTVTATDENDSYVLGIQNPQQVSGTTTVNITSTLTAEELAQYVVAVYPTDADATEWSGDKEFTFDELNGLSALLTDQDVGYHAIEIKGAEGTEGLTTYIYILKAQQQLMLNLAGSEVNVEELYATTDALGAYPAGELEATFNVNTAALEGYGLTWDNGVLTLPEGEHYIDVRYSASYGGNASKSYSFAITGEEAVPELPVKLMISTDGGSGYTEYTADQLPLTIPNGETYWYKFEGDNLADYTLNVEWYDSDSGVNTFLEGYVSPVELGTDARSITNSNDLGGIRIMLTKGDESTYHHLFQFPNEIHFVFDGAVYDMEELSNNGINTKEGTYTYSVVSSENAQPISGLDVQLRDYANHPVGEGDQLTLEAGEGQSHLLMYKPAGFNLFDNLGISYCAFNFYVEELKPAAEIATTNDDVTMVGWIPGEVLYEADGAVKLLADQLTDTTTDELVWKTAASADGEQNEVTASTTGGYSTIDVTATPDNDVYVFLYKDGGDGEDVLLDKVRVIHGAPNVTLRVEQGEDAMTCVENDTAKLMHEVDATLTAETPNALFTINSIELFDKAGDSMSYGPVIGTELSFTPYASSSPYKVQVTYNDGTADQTATFTLALDPVTVVYYFVPSQDEVGNPDAAVAVWTGAHGDVIAKSEIPQEDTLVGQIPEGDMLTGWTNGGYNIWVAQHGDESLIDAFAGDYFFPVIAEEVTYTFIAGDGANNPNEETVLSHPQTYTAEYMGAAPSNYGYDMMMEIPAEPAHGEEWEFLGWVDENGYNPWDGDKYTDLGWTDDGLQILPADWYLPIDEQLGTQDVVYRGLWRQRQPDAELTVEGMPVENGDTLTFYGDFTDENTLTLKLHVNENGREVASRMLTINGAEVPADADAVDYHYFEVTEAGTYNGGLVVEFTEGTPERTDISFTIEVLDDSLTGEYRDDVEGEITDMYGEVIPDKLWTETDTTTLLLDYTYDPELTEPVIEWRYSSTTSSTLSPVPDAWKVDGNPAQLDMQLVQGEVYDVYAYADGTEVDMVEVEYNACPVSFKVGDDETEYPAGGSVTLYLKSGEAVSVQGIGDVTSMEADSGENRGTAYNTPDAVSTVVIPGIVWDDENTGATYYVYAYNGRNELGMLTVNMYPIEYTARVVALDADGNEMPMDENAIVKVQYAEGSSDVLTFSAVTDPEGMTPYWELRYTSPEGVAESTTPDVPTASIGVAGEYHALLYSDAERTNLLDSLIVEVALPLDYDVTISINGEAYDGQDIYATAPFTFNFTDNSATNPDAAIVGTHAWKLFANLADGTSELIGDAVGSEDGSDVTIEATHDEAVSYTVQLVEVSPMATFALNGLIEGQVISDVTFYTGAADVTFTVTGATAGAIGEDLTNGSSVEVLYDDTITIKAMDNAEPAAEITTGTWSVTDEESNVLASSALTDAIVYETFKKPGTYTVTFTTDTNEVYNLTVEVGLPTVTEVYFYQRTENGVDITATAQNIALVDGTPGELKLYKGDQISIVGYTNFATDLDPEFLFTTPTGYHSAEGHPYTYNGTQETLTGLYVKYGDDEPIKLDGDYTINLSLLTDPTITLADENGEIATPEAIEDGSKLTLYKKLEGQYTLTATDDKGVTYTWHNAEGKQVSEGATLNILSASVAERTYYLYGNGMLQHETGITVAIVDNPQLVLKLDGDDTVYSESHHQFTSDQTANAATLTYSVLGDTAVSGDTFKGKIVGPKLTDVTDVDADSPNVTVDLSLPGFYSFALQDANGKQLDVMTINVLAQGDFQLVMDYDPAKADDQQFTLDNGSVVELADRAKREPARTFTVMPTTDELKAAVEALEEAREDYAGEGYGYDWLAEAQWTVRPLMSDGNSIMRNDEAAPGEPNGPYTTTGELVEVSTRTPGYYQVSVSFINPLDQSTETLTAVLHVLTDVNIQIKDVTDPAAASEAENVELNSTYYLKEGHSYELTAEVTNSAYTEDKFVWQGATFRAAEPDGTGTIETVVIENVTADYQATYYMLYEPTRLPYAYLHLMTEPEEGDTIYGEDEEGDGTGEGTGTGDGSDDTTGIGDEPMIAGWLEELLEQDEVFTAIDETTELSNGNNVTLVVKDTDFADEPPVYEVELNWGDMAFKLTRVTSRSYEWDPRTHTHHQVGATSTSTKGWNLVNTSELALSANPDVVILNDVQYGQDHIIIFNHSNMPVEATLQLDDASETDGVDVRLSKVEGAPASDSTTKKYTSTLARGDESIRQDVPNYEVTESKVYNTPDAYTVAKVTPSGTPATEIASDTETTIATVTITLKKATE